MSLRRFASAFYGALSRDSVAEEVRGVCEKKKFGMKCDEGDVGSTSFGRGEENNGCLDVGTIAIRKTVDVDIINF